MSQNQVIHNILVHCIGLLMHDLEFRICDRLKCGYMSDHRSLQFRQSVFEHFAFNCFVMIACVFVCFFSFVFLYLLLLH